MDKDLANSIGRKNASLREKGGFAVREFDRVVETFNKVLLYKERIRLSLEEKVSILRGRDNENRDQLATLSRNIQIYYSNIERIEANLSELQKEENEIKDKYEKMLRGASLMNASAESESTLSEGEIDDGLSREDLIQRRRDYLENLNNNFKQMDMELYSIDGLRQEMKGAREEIYRKKEKALQKKEILEDNEKRLAEETRRTENELENSIREEQVLLDEFAKLIHNVEDCIEINDEIDHVLFSSLTAAEARSSIN